MFCPLQERLIRKLIDILNCNNQSRYAAHYFLSVYRSKDVRGHTGEHKIVFSQNFLDLASVKRGVSAANRNVPEIYMENSIHVASGRRNL